MRIKCVLGLTKDQWHNTTLPKDESKESQLKKKAKLLKWSKIPRSKQDISTIKQLCEDTYASQRKDILEMHKIIKDFQTRKSRKKITEEESYPEISDLVNEWPFLFRTEMTLHMNRLYNINVEDDLSLYMNFTGKQVLDYLVFSQGMEGKVLEQQMTKSKEKSAIDEPEVLSLLMLFSIHFKEKVGKFIIKAEVSLQMKDVRDLPIPLTPCILSCGSDLFRAEKYYACMDKYCYFATRSFREAFCVVFSSYFVFHLDFPQNFGLTLEYIQRQVFDINPEVGTKRAEGSSSSPVSVKILDVIRDCQAYHTALQKANSVNDQDSPLNLSKSSNISFSQTSS
ncbi:uncharacterized protein LOC113209207 [Frankliniella occidentalis]|uniref:Uncharacterized protein LOC113209207 n=1 Tax=Frankliniella occidentalis TaxID=133901 RepID=A0A9C6X2X2_FRAOC|nr:uncharacterized protein LOC113209207 [Frankliniella occidentalis]